MVEIRQVYDLTPMYHSKKFLRDVGRFTYSGTLPYILFKDDIAHPIRVVSQYFSLDLLRNKCEVLW